MSIQGADSFNRYGAVSDLSKTANCPISWNPITPSHLSLVPESARYGGRAIQIGDASATGTAASLNGTFTAGSLATWILGLGINLDLITGTVFDIALVDFTQGTANIGTTQVNIQLNQSTGSIQVFNAAGTSLGSLSSVIPGTEWFYLNLEMLVGSSTGSLLVNLGTGDVNTTLFNLNNIDTQGGTNTTWNGVILSVPSVSGTLQGGAYVTDVVLQDTVAPTGGIIQTNQPLGPCYVIPIYPTANSGTQGWTPDNTGYTNYQEVNSPQSNDGTTSISATQDVVNVFNDLYSFGTISSAIDLVPGVQATGLYSNLGTVSAEVQNNIVSSGQTSTSGVFTLSPSSGYEFYSAPCALDPGTGSTWTSNSVNMVDAGPQLSAAGTTLISIGGTLVNAGGSLNDGTNPKSISGSFTASAGFLATYTVIHTYVGWPLGTLGGISTLIIANEEVTTADIPGANFQADTYSVPAEIIGSYSVTDGTTAGPTSVTGSANYVIGGTGTLTVEYLQYVTNVVDEEGYGNTQITTAAGVFTAIDSDVGPVVSGNDVYNYWNITVTNCPVSYNLLMRSATLITGQAVRCSQFLIEAIVFASSYGTGSGGSGMPPIFPTLVGITWPVLRRPIFSNVVSTGQSGAEARYLMWSEPLWEWELDFEYLPNEIANGTTASDYKTLLGFFLSVQGNGLPFLFNDQDDNYASNDILATTDGTSTAYLITRTYGLNDGTGTEPIGYLNETTTPEFFLNGTLVSSSEYTLNTTTPLQQQIVFDTAPTEGQILTWTGYYYFYCRFGEEKQDFSKMLQNVWETSKLVLRSLRQA